MRNFRIFSLLFVINLFTFFQAWAFDIKEITPKQFTSTIENEKIRLIYIFTSWCSVCKRALPEVIGLFDDFNQKEVEIILISLDKDNEIIRSFFKLFNNKSFTIYRLKYDDPQEVMHTLINAGILYKGSIPHATLLDETDNVVVDGNYKVESLKKGIEYLIKNK